MLLFAHGLSPVAGPILHPDEFLLWLSFAAMLIAPVVAWLIATSD